MTADSIWGGPTIGDAMLHGLAILDEWSIVDHWWTAEPIYREFQQVEEGGRRYVRKRERGGPWVEMPELADDRRAV